MNAKDYKKRKLFRFASRQLWAFDFGSEKKKNKAKSKTQVSCNCGGKQRHYVGKEMMTYPGTRILVLGFCLLLDSSWPSLLSQVSILRAALCPKLRVANFASAWICLHILTCRPWTLPRHGTRLKHDHFDRSFCWLLSWGTMLCNKYALNCMKLKLHTEMKSL